jgi:rare lipoprotein A
MAVLLTGLGTVPLAGVLTAAGSTGPILVAQAPPPAAGTAPAAFTGAVGETQTGLAAYYSWRLQGRRTASGERFNNRAMTTAHQTLPFGTRIKVTNPANGKSVVLRVNDRGPTQPKRILDVSFAAARQLGIVRAGLVEVKLEVVEAAKPRPTKAAS